MSAVKLSTAQRSFLAAAFAHTRHTNDGACLVFPRGAGPWATVRSLCRLGLLEFVTADGRDIDGEVEEDVCLFGPTETGARLAFEPGDIDGSELCPGIQAGLRALCRVPS